MWTMVKKKRFLSLLRMKCWTKCSRLRCFSWTELSTFAWCQLYSIHCLVDDAMCPVAYALPPRKSNETYVGLFTLINTAADTRIGAPRVIRTDFEGAAFQDAQKVYPGVNIRGYYFNFSQAVWRNVAEKDLAVEYRTNPDLQRHVRRAAALPLLPLNQVQDVWMDILNNSPHIKARAVQQLHHRDMGGR